jgi:hypothetical protein
VNNNKESKLENEKEILSQGSIEKIDKPYLKRQKLDKNIVSSLTASALSSIHKINFNGKRISTL